MADFRVKTKSRLIDYLIGIGHTRTKVKQLLKRGAVDVNGKTAGGLHRLLHEGDIVTVRKGMREKKVLPPAGIRIVFEDESIIVIEKPAGLLTIASEKEKIKTAYFQINEFLKMRGPEAGERIFIVHRLDRDTSGLIVFAKTEKVKRILQHTWSEAEKRYYAVVEGAPKKKEGEIISNLSETKSLMVYSNPNEEQAKPARTKYSVVKQGHEYSLLDVVLETGRRNQIRVHLSDIGCPVAGDRKYGAKTGPLNRLGLHAYLLVFNHPVSGKAMRFESKMPGQFGIPFAKRTEP